LSKAWGPAATFESVQTLIAVPPFLALP
jgi:hypothetical protein